MGGRVAPVTGAAGGIGGAVASGLSSNGHSTAFVDTDSARLPAIERQLGGSGGEVLGLAADVRPRRDVDGAVARVVERFGRLDVVVNAAGSVGLLDFLQMPTTDWQRVVDVNLTGTFHVCQTAGRVMVAQGWGHIIDIASGRGLHGLARGAHYAASKGCGNRLHEINRGRAEATRSVCVCRSAGSDRYGHVSGHSRHGAGSRSSGFGLVASP